MNLGLFSFSRNLHTTLWKTNNLKTKGDFKMNEKLKKACVAFVVMNAVVTVVDYAKKRISDRQYKRGFNDGVNTAIAVMNFIEESDEKEKNKKKKVF